jgi:hypothetical protein
MADIPTLAAKMLDQFSSAVKGKPPLSPVSVPEYLAEAMQLAEGVSGLTGPQKQSLVLTVLNSFVNNLPLSELEKSAILLIINTVGPCLINTIIAAGKGLYNFGVKVEEVCEKECIGCC